MIFYSLDSFLLDDDLANFSQEEITIPIDCTIQKCSNGIITLKNINGNIITRNINPYT